jgi:hypothetical protein
MIRRLPYEKTQWEKFCKALPGPCMIFTKELKPGLFGRLTQVVTRSPWQHVATYIGKSLAEKVKTKYPQLLKRRRFVWKNHDIELTDVPAESVIREIIESDAYVRRGSLDEYNRADNQLSALIMPMTTQEAENVAFRAYLMHGMPYDVQEIASYVTPLKNPEGGKIYFENGQSFDAGLKVCSSKTAFAFGIPELRLSPGQLYDKIKKLPEVTERKFNWK